MSWLGLDIGGANIKAAMAGKIVKSVPFRFWVEHDRLSDELKNAITSFVGHGVTRIAATMTAELADCFETRQSGVEQIVDSLESVCSELGLPSPVFAGTDICFRKATEAKETWIKTAASNWSMLSKYASRFLPDSTGLVIDMGSTTTDIIPVQNGLPIAEGTTDSTRLQHGELVYVGFDRTPVSSIVNGFKTGESKIPIARELFATAGDAMLLSDLCDEDINDTDTADGRPKTKQHASQRLCRMICEDANLLPRDLIDSFAAQVLDGMEEILSVGINSVLSRHQMDHAIVTGSGKWFMNRLLMKRYPDIKTIALDGEIDAAAPAFAVAILASELVEDPTP